MSVPRNNEAISKYTILGTEYVKLSELNALIHDIMVKTRKADEPGYLNPDEGQRISAYLALNHLRVVLNKEKIHSQTVEKIMRFRFVHEADMQDAVVEEILEEE